MATHEKIEDLLAQAHRLLDELPEDEVPDALEYIASRGTKSAADADDDEVPIPTLEESIEILASIDFPPREEAWH